VPTNPYSRFSATSIKPALGSAFAFASDVTILMQETGKLFGMMDAGERDRVRTAPGLRTVVEVLKSRVSVSRDDDV
jgi:DNA repair protein RAD51